MNRVTSVSTPFRRLSRSPPTAVLELTAGTQSIGQVPMQLAAPGPDGRIKNSAQLPLANFPPGEYGMKITVTQGAAKEVREAKATIVD